MCGKEQPCSCGSPKKELEGIRDRNLGSRGDTDRSQGVPQSTGSSSAKPEDKSELDPSLGSSRKERMGIQRWIPHKPTPGWSRSVEDPTMEIKITCA